MIFALVVSLLSVSCGGGGGGGGGGVADELHVEAVLANDPTKQVDPLNIQLGEQIQFRVVLCDPIGTTTIVPSSNWRTNDSTGLGGTLSSDGLLIVASETNGQFTISADTGQGVASASYQVKAIQALVAGLVVDSNGVPASHVSVRFFNAGGTELGRSTTACNGRYRASVPSTVVEFNLLPSSMPTTRYYRSFVFATKRYTALDTTCSAPTGVLTNGGTKNLGNITVDALVGPGGGTNPPPPPPDGCF